MTLINKRITFPQAATFNGIALGALSTMRIQAGHDQVVQTHPDGLQIPIADRFTQFIRGNTVVQDWSQFISLLTGTIGSFVFYERKSGVAEASGYMKHTLNNPVVHRAGITIVHRGYGSCNADFECQFADPEYTHGDVWVPTDSQAAPTYLPATRSVEITAGTHGPTSIYHITRFDFNIAFKLMKASHDGDFGYTAVDRIYGGIAPSGTIVFQDASITTAKLKIQDLLNNSRAALTLTVRNAAGATAKTLTINGVHFTAPGEHAGDAQTTEPDTFSLPFVVTNDASTPLTLSGTNKIVTIV